MEATPFFNDFFHVIISKMKEGIMLKEFKTFIMKGNVFDLAVGVIIGGAMGRIVTSLVNDVIMPLLSLLIGRIDLTQIKYVISEGNETNPEVAVLIGSFLQNIINFVIIGFVIFITIKFMSKLKKKEAVVEAVEAVVQPSEEILLLRDIAASLKK